MPTTLDFLRAILPAQGKFCAVVIDQARNVRRQYFYDTVEALADGLLTLDRTLEGTHGAVYHGCAAYSTTRRTQGSVRALSALWLDVDAGPEKPYADQEQAIIAVREFAAALGAHPLVVGSGRGLHVYFPLASALTRDQWQPYADRLKALCVERGLHAGPERTADAASILRPPGTLHRKGETPLPVICGPIPPKLTLEQLNERLSIRPGVIATGHSLPHRAGRTEPVRRLSDKLANVTAPEPIDFAALCHGCAQLSRFAAEQGRIPEPLWYAGLGVLAFCAGGDSIAHAWSAGHPTYSAGETDARLARLRSLSGPTTCAKFKDLDGQRCQGCRYGQGTPLDAARGEHAAAKPTPSPASPPAPTTIDLTDGDAVDGHSEWQYRGGELVYVSEDLKKHEVLVKLTSFPVQIASVHTGELNGDRNYYRLRHYKPHAGWREVTLKAAQLHGRETTTTLADLGIIVHDPTRFQAFVRDAVDALHKRRRSGMQYEQFGWKGDSNCFLWGDRLYTPTGIEVSAISEQLKFRSQWLQPTPGGSLEGWKQAVDSLMGSGSEGMSFTVLASFAALLMRFMTVDEGGAVISLMTRHSGAGKSTSLAGAYTVWANNLHALSIVTIDTKVSKAVLMGQLGNLPVIFDELTSKDPSVVRELIVTFTSGRDKNRAESNGTGLVNNAYSWQTLLLTASNKSLVDTILSTGEGDAPAMRILELPIESSGQLKPSEAEAMEKLLQRNAGWAGEAFLQALMIPGVLAHARERLPKMMDEIYQKGGFRKEHRFWVRTLAAVGVAASIVERYGLISFSSQRIMRWAVEHFAGKRLGEPSEASRSMLPALAQFLNERLDETLTMPGPAEGRKRMQPIGEAPRRKVTVRMELEGDGVWIAVQPLREFLERTGGGYSDLVAELKQLGMLKAANRLVTLTAGSDIRGGQIYALGFSANHPRFDGLMREAREDVRSAAAVDRLRAAQ